MKLRTPRTSISSQPGASVRLPGGEGGSSRRWLAAPGRRILQAARRAAGEPAAGLAVEADARFAFPQELDPAQIVDVDTSVGRLFLHRDDAVMTPFISETGYWEPDEAAFLRAALRPGATFLDVGANVGYMTVLGARSVGSAGRVIAVEPDTQNLKLLRANLWRNGLSAHVLPIAAYSRRGFIRFVRNETNRGDHQVSEEAGAGSLVPCASMDETLGRLHVDVVKVDTQGVDHEVLEGIVGLARRNPAIVILSEFWLGGLLERGIDPAAVLARYHELGFTLGLLAPGGSVRRADAHQVIEACRAWEGLYANVVLTADGRPPSVGARRTV